MGEMRVINIQGVDCYEKDGTAYLKLDAVAHGLGFTQIKNGVEYIRWETVNNYLKDLGFSQLVGKDSFIPENIFYRLAMKAKNSVAEAFQAKVADEIIPSIRKHGAYIAGQESMTREQLIAKALVAANDIIDEQNKHIRQLAETNAFQAEQIEEMAPKASYCDRILASKDLVPITQIAKDYGMSAIEMNRLLHEHGYQYRRNKTWVLYDKYAGFGYTSSKTHLYEDKGGREHSQMSTQWTQAGRLFLYEELKKFEILPMIERGLI